MKESTELLILAGKEHFTESYTCGGCGKTGLLCRAVYDEMSWLPPTWWSPFHSQDCIDAAGEQAQAGGGD